MSLMKDKNLLLLGILQNQKVYWFKTIQGILSLEKSYTKEIVELACKRALAFQVFEYLYNLNWTVSQNVPDDVEFVNILIQLFESDILCDISGDRSTACGRERSSLENGSEIR